MTADDELARVVAENVLPFRPSGNNPYMQIANVFTERHRNTSVQIKRGERIFVLSDKGIDECPNSGPDEVMIMTESFGSWPVVAFVIPARHVEAWRRIDPEVSAPRMMARVRRRLADALAQHEHRETNDG